MGNISLCTLKSPTLKVDSVSESGSRKRSLTMWKSLIQGAQALPSHRGTNSLLHGDC